MSYYSLYSTIYAKFEVIPTRNYLCPRRLQYPVLPPLLLNFEKSRIVCFRICMPNFRSDQKKNFPTQTLIHPLTPFRVEFAEILSY